MTGRAGRRALRPDELALWRLVTQTVKSFRPQPPEAAERAPTPPSPATPPLPLRAPPALPPRPAEALPRLAPLEPRLRRRLERGRAEIEDVLDLHGATEAEAHRRVVDFIMRRHAEGVRLVLIVTGRGRSEQGAQGVLYRNAPHWLRATPMRRFVVSVERAGRAHGGEGALYVRLRRRKPGLP